MFKLKDLKSISLEETIAYSKQKESCTITVIDNLSAEEFEYVATVAERLRLNIFRITDTRMIAVIQDTEIAKKLAKDLNKRCQIMYYDYAKRPSANLVSYALTGYTPSWIVLKDNGYIVKAYNEEGQETDSWINTDIETTTVPKLNVSPYSISLRIRGCGNSKRSNETILKLSKQHYINGGNFNEERQCYYPADISSNKGIADYNKLEKLFTKWGFKSL